MRGLYAVRRPVLNSYLVRQRDRHRRRELGLVLLATVPLALGLLGYVWINLQLLDTGYEIHRLERKLEFEVENRRRMQMEASYLSSPQVVENRAARELGMAAPNLDQVVFVEELP